MHAFKTQFKAKSNLLWSRTLKSIPIFNKPMGGTNAKVSNRNEESSETCVHCGMLPVAETSPLPLAFCGHFQFNNKVFHPNSTILCWKVLIFQTTLFCCNKLVKWPNWLHYWTNSLKTSLYSMYEFIGRWVDCLWSICILKMCWGWWTFCFI